MSLIWVGVDIAKSPGNVGHSERRDSSAQRTPSRRELPSKRLLQKRFGPPHGGVWTSYIMWEWDGPKAKELAGWAVGRKVGATQTCQDIPEKGTNELTITDGKVTGWTASGQCVVTMGTGDFASMAGKTWYWNAKPTGPMTYEINSTVK